MLRGSESHIMHVGDFERRSACALMSYANNDGLINDPPMLCCYKRCITQVGVIKSNTELIRVGLLYGTKVRVPVTRL